MILNSAELAANGVEGNWAFGFKDTVRFRDLDSYNHVNNVVYHSWFEDIRVLFFEELNLKVTNQSDIMFVMRAADISFNEQMAFGDTYHVLMRPVKLGNSSFTIEYAVQRDGSDVVTGSSVVVLSDIKAGAAVSIPDDARQRISAYL